MRGLIFVLSAVVAATVFVGCNDDFNAPQAMRTALTSQYPGATNVEWEKKRGYIVAEFRLPGTSNDCEAWYTSDGVWVMTEFDIRYSDLPAAVRTAFESEYGVDTPVDDVKRIERSNGEIMCLIEATVIVNGMLADIYIEYLADGTVLRTAIEVDADYFYGYYLM